MYANFEVHLQNINNGLKLVEVSLASWPDVCRDVVCSVDKRLDESFVSGHTTCSGQCKRVKFKTHVFSEGEMSTA